MKVLKINSNRPEEKIIREAVEVLKNDGSVVYPTDTLYGIGANALSKRAILKVYEIKGREFRKPLSISFHSLSEAKKYVEFNSLALKLAKKFLPGPLTIILPMKYNFPKELTGGSENVGVRIPDNKVALRLIETFGYPITATSANISGQEDPTTAEEVMSQIGMKTNLILDAGKCNLNKPSTVVSIVDDQISVLREGAITKEALKI